MDQFAQQMAYVIEDPVAGQFYRLGQAEHVFASLLDGKRTLAEALAAAADQLGDQAFDEQEAAAFCQWLVGCRLALTHASASEQRVAQDAQKAQRARWRQWTNPLILRFAWTGPDRILQAMAPWCGWLFGPWGAALWLLLVVVAAMHLWVRSDELLSMREVIIAPGQWWLLAVVWLVLKLGHECAHGVVCRRYGGETRQAGVMLLLGVPLPFVDVTSSWRFGNRWKRIHVAAAGMYLDLLAAAIAAIVWSYTRQGVVHDYAFRVIVTAGVATLLFNANPLMRFDGYYIFTDLLHLPNLATQGQAMLTGWLGRVFLGWPRPRMAGTRSEHLWIAGYGVAAFLWRILVCAALLVAAEAMWDGAGVILAIMALFAWLAGPLYHLVRILTVHPLADARSRFRMAAMVSGLALAAWMLGTGLPWRETLKAPAVVDYERLSDVRAGTAGFVEQLLVHSGDVVEQGQLLVRLSNLQLESDIRDLQLTIQSSRRKAAVHHLRGELAAEQVEHEQRLAHQQRLEELLGHQAALNVRAPHGGRILAPRLADLLGTYIDTGGALLTVADESTRHVRALIAQQDFAWVAPLQGSEVVVHLWGDPCGERLGRLDTLSPRASDRLPHPGLAATAGGPLAVKAMPSDQGEWRLTSPYFTAEVHFNTPLLGAAAGQTGVLKCVVDRGSLGQAMWRRFQHWLEDARRRLRAASA